VENFPEFWTLIKEVWDYEIVQMISTHSHKIYNINETPDGEFSFNGYPLISWAENHDKLVYEIYSIKCKKTGIIITVGDEVIYRLYEKDRRENNIPFIIESIGFEVAPSDKGKRILSFNHNHITLGRWLSLERISHPQPIELKWGVHVETWKIKDEINSKLIHNYETSWLWFDNKSERDEYIYNEKPTISRRELQDIKEIVINQISQVLELK